MCGLIEKIVTHPKVAGEELRTSGGTYAAVPTNVQALSSGQAINWTFLISLSKVQFDSFHMTRFNLTWCSVRKNCNSAILHRLYTPKIGNFNMSFCSKQQVLGLPFEKLLE
jgi:hypothetical protein